MASHEDQLRAWAKGSRPQEAATELLLRVFDGRFARLGNPWVRTDRTDGAVWIDFELIPENLDALSSGERRLLMIAASLADVGVEVNMGNVIPGLDYPVLDLVLAAVAHAGGSHQHTVILENADGSHSLVHPPALYRWP